MRTLHNIGPHVSAHNGWAPVGWQVDDDGDTLIDEDPPQSIYDPFTDELDPGEFGLLEQYNTWDPTTPAQGGPCAPEVMPGYTADQQCWGCHGDDVPPWQDEDLDWPSIDNDVEGIQPIAGSCGVYVTLRGNNFGSEHIVGRGVWLDLIGDGLWTPVDMPIHAWTDTLIEFEIPCWQLAKGNYRVYVYTEVGTSNFRVFTVNDHPTVLSVTPESGPCGTVITLSGDGGFQPTPPIPQHSVNGSGKLLDVILGDGYHGRHLVVDVVSSGYEYTATWFVSITDTSLQFILYNFFEDLVDECGPSQQIDNDMDGSLDEDPINGIDDDSDTLVDEDPPDYIRNFVQDPAPTGPCPDACDEEPLIRRCDCVALGTFQIYVKAVYFGDDDSSGDLTCGDTIFQVEKSDPVQFELTNTPVLYKLNPRRTERYFVEDCVPDPDIWHLNQVKIYGMNFGPQQDGGKVCIGQRSHWYAGNCVRELLVRMWSNTLLKVRPQLPSYYQDVTRCVWVEKDGVKSNYKLIKILNDSTLCP
jgi:hypothetical protein